MKLNAEHGIVCNLPEERFGYFAWPTIARVEDGTLVVACSGLRMGHVCPFGKTMLCFSHDEGKTWSQPSIVNDTLMDDRDAGVISLGGKALLLSWFISDTREHFEYCKTLFDEATVESWKKITSTWTEDMVRKLKGSWVRTSSDGTNWREPVKVPVSAPHGPILLRNGDILYLGKEFGLFDVSQTTGPIKAYCSRNGGCTWGELGTVPNCEGTTNANYHEPHVVELPSGKLLGLIRYQNDTAGYINFSMFQTESLDGGKTWSKARPLGIYGSPPHLICHSSGVLICAYGHRESPFGQRVMISSDEGKTWQSDFVLRDDAPDYDLGYPASVELPDKSIFTVYYQKTAAGKKCSLLYSRWQLPNG